jgi:hypothetical protein
MVGEETPLMHVHPDDRATREVGDGQQYHESGPGLYVQGPRASEDDPVEVIEEEYRPPVEWGRLTIYAVPLAIAAAIVAGVEAGRGWAPKFHAMVAREHASYVHAGTHSSYHNPGKVFMVLVLGAVVVAAAGALRGWVRGR